MKISFSFSKARLLSAVLLAAAAVAVCLVCGGTVKFAAVIAAAFLAAGLLHLRAEGRRAWVLLPPLLAVSALFCVLLAQEADGIRDPLTAENYLLGTLCVLFPALLLYALQLLISRRGPGLPICLSSGAWMALAVVSVWTVANRGSTLIPADIFAARTALGVLDHYTLVFSAHMCYSVIGYVWLVFLWTGLRIEPLPRLGLRRLAVFGCALLVGAGLWFGARSRASNQWLDQGTLTNGFTLNFTLALRESFPAKPAGYSAESIAALEAEYPAPAAPGEAVKPQIIAIMNESYTDLQVLGSFETDRPVTPFADSLTENTFRGYAYSSVYGGTTPNSEYEFLTGNSMAFLSAAVPFSQLIREPSYSLVGYLNSLGYTCWATHPMNSRFWNREKVYPLLGFSEFEAIEGYEGAPTFRVYTKDEAVYDHILRELNTRRSGENKFIYAVTVQNHGGYKATDVFEEEVRPVGFDSVDSMVYLTLMHESDKAFQKLIEALQDMDEPVVLLLFGDHQPNASDEFIRYAHGGDLETLDEQMQKYLIPYLIWANYDIEMQSPEICSINYLSDFLLEAAGLPLPSYNRALEDIRQTIPALNSFGYYSLSQGRFQTLAEAEGAEKAALTRYELLEYNAIFDRRGRSQVFFPAPAVP